MPQLSISLKGSQAYKRYIAGMPDENGNTNGRRWSGLDPFERDDNDFIQLPLGEVFCRMLMGDNSLCINEFAFSTPANLKTHIEGVHRAACIQVHLGSSTMLEIREAIKYYNTLMRSIDNNGSGMPATPAKAAHSTRRGGRLTRPARQEESEGQEEEEEAEISLELADLPIPVYKTSGPGREKGAPNYKEMKKCAGIAISSVCDRCREHNSAACPPFNPTLHCSVWVFYKNKITIDDLLELI
ncbi:hypothetical protein MKX08_002119 [Trichoderma sp. CBMAI-0020]|nr:hypothetical protein MKX08_002119 [Trichoderma sp. CBMAI-0020]